jgi:hypothetical protein
MIFNRKITAKFFYFLLAYFIAFYAFSLLLYYNDLFKFHDIFFDTDPDTNLNAFAHGKSRHAISHPFLEFFSIPVIILELLFSYFGLIPEKESLAFNIGALNGQSLLAPSSFREIFVLTFSPFFSVLTIHIFNELLKLQKLPDQTKFATILLFSFGFSNIVFAAIVETYALSGLLILATIYYSYHLRIARSSGSLFMWGALATFLCGVTITNICIFSIVFFIHNLMNLKNNFFRSLFYTLCMSISSLIFVLVIFFVSHKILQVPPGNEGKLDWIKLFLSFDISHMANNAYNFLVAMLHTFIGYTPSYFDSESCWAKICTPVVAVSFERPLTYTGLFIVAAFFIILYVFRKAIIKTYKNHQESYFLFIISLLILGYNFILHSIFGRELFMYSQHWVAALSILLIPVIALRPTSSTYAILAMTSLNIFQIHEIYYKLA